MLVRRNYPFLLVTLGSRDSEIPKALMNNVSLVMLEGYQ